LPGGTEVAAGGRWRIGRLVLLPAFLVVAAWGGAPPTLAPAARLAAAASAADASIPLLLLHDADDDCASAWRATSAAAYLTAAGFTTLDPVGYYGSTRGGTAAGDSAPGVCTENLQRLPPLPGLGRFPGVDRCDALEPDSRVYGTGDDHLNRLSCLLAWYVYERYTQFGKPVDVLAHGMGGLLVRDAIGATGIAARDFPPHPLWVTDVVTVATPHGGIDGTSAGGAEVDDMRAGRPFMASIAAFQRPQGYGGTRWALVGSSAQVSFQAGAAGGRVVAAASQMAMAADEKIVYGTGGTGAVDGRSFLEDRGADPIPARTCAGCAGTPGGDARPAPRALPAIAAELRAEAPPALPSRELTMRSTANDKYVSAELGYGRQNPLYGTLRARAAVQGDWERWTAVQLPSGHWAIRSDDSGLYVAAELGRGGDDYNELRARTDFADLGPWELFDAVPNPDGSFSLQLADLDRDYYYVTAELSMSGPRYGLLRARNSSVGPWERLTSGGPPPGPVLLGTPDFDGYCRMARLGGARVVPGNPFSWACTAPGAAPDPQAVCAWTYWTHATSRLADLRDPYSWQCRG
jgi:hypothetical protein